MALVQLQMEEMLVSMNGYANIDIISHSWGTCLSYDLLNNSSIEVHDWVTMGSPLKRDTRKPVENTGNWFNYYSKKDPVTQYEIISTVPQFWGNVRCCEKKHTRWARVVSRPKHTAKQRT